MKGLRRFLGCIVLLALLAACAQPTGSAGNLAGRKIKVTTTVGMIADIVKNVGGTRVEVTGLMGAGVDPHLYKPSASDITRLNEADIIFYGGLELEGRMTDTFVKLARTGKPTIAVSEQIDPSKLREPKEFEGKYDPHIWFDVTLWQEASRTVRDELIRLDPSSKAYYEEQGTAYLRQLDELHSFVKTQIQSIPAASRVLITAHDAFGYFGDQYGMEVRGLQGTSTSSEVGVADMQALAAFVTERKIKAIFVESSVPDNTIKALQEAVKSRGWQVNIGGQLYSDAMGNEGTPEGTYIGMVKHNVTTIVTALK